MTQKQQKLSSSAENYLEAIYLLNKEKKEVGTTDIANFLKVKSPSVTEMLRKLKQKNLIKYEKYGKVELTTKGKKIGKEITEKHNDLINFLKTLGVNEKTAKKDACKIEHVVGEESMQKLRTFLQFVENSPKNPKWLKHYQHYMKTGQHPECDNQEKTN